MALSQLAPVGFQREPEFGRCTARNSVTRQHYNIKSLHGVEVPAEAFPDNPFDSVTRYSGAHPLARDGQPKTRFDCAVGACKHGECCVHGSLRILEYPSEVAAATQAQTLRQAFTGPASTRTQAESRARPLARRDLITWRPDFVRMRTRKPWLRLRLSLLG